jgi:DNA-3-methyladenine glycosylase I
VPTRDNFEDGLSRCGWLNSDPLYIHYHDTEWGVPVRGDNAMFERVALEGFQAGLSWFTILKRREGFREAFHGFDMAKVVEMNEADVELLMLNDGIIKNRAKIVATIKNAKLALEVPGGLSDFLWGFAPSHSPVKGITGKGAVGSRAGAAEEFAWRVTTPESDAMSKELKKLGFGFVGSTTMHALMQATGMLNDHAPGCFRKAELEN